MPDSVIARAAAAARAEAERVLRELAARGDASGDEVEALRQSIAAALERGSAAVEARIAPLAEAARSLLQIASLAARVDALEQRLAALEARAAAPAGGDPGAGGA